MLQAPARISDKSFQCADQVSSLSFNPLDALDDDVIFELFSGMLAHRYRTDILDDYYHLPDIPLQFTCRSGTKVTPREKAKQELEFLRVQNGTAESIGHVVDAFWEQMRPQNDHLKEHLDSEDKYNQIAIYASDLKLLKPVFYLYPDHHVLNIADIGAGRNRLGHAIGKYFDRLADSVSYFNWLENGGSSSDRKEVNVIGTDVHDWHDAEQDAIPNVTYRIQPSATEIPIDSNSRDIVITKWCFHHMTPDEMWSQIGSILRILKPGGVVIVVEAFLSAYDRLPDRDEGVPELTFFQQLREISRRIEYADIWPSGPWKQECLQITSDYLKLPVEKQLSLLALEDFFGHLVLNGRRHMPFPFSYMPAEQLIQRFIAAGFEEVRENFLLFGFAPIIRRGPPTARFMFRKPVCQDFCFK